MRKGRISALNHSSIGPLAMNNFQRQISGILKVRLILAFFVVLLFQGVTQQLAFALENPGEELEQSGLIEHLGNTVNIDLPFTTEDGNTITLREILADGKPIILTPVYYSCPRLCGLVLSGVVDLLNKVSVRLGREFNVVTISFDVSETPKLAKKRSEQYRAKLTDKEVPVGGWRFLVGNEESVSATMDQIGFRYKKDGGEFAHSAAIIVLTPQGKISQYFTGVEFSPWDVKLALVDASMGAIGSAVDHVLLYCFRFDPTKGKYTLAVFNVLKIGGALSLAALGTVLVLAARKS